MCGAGFQPGTYLPVVLFSRIFSIHQEHLFSGTPESVCCSYLYIYIYIYYNVFFYSFYFFVSSKNKTPCTCFPANWVLLIVIDKFTIIEFAPFSLFTKGAFVTFGKILWKKCFHRCFAVKFAKFLRTPIPKNICTLLLLNTGAAFQKCSAEVVVQH